MKKQILFIHSAGAQSDTEGSGPFLRRLHRETGNSYMIKAPSMPRPGNPDCLNWMDTIDAKIHLLKGPVILIGHSFGGAVLFKYLSERTVEVPIAGLHVIAAPYWGLEEWGSENCELKPGFGQKLTGIPIHLYHSKDDEIVPFPHLKQYQKKLPRASTHELDGYGHLFQRGLPGEFLDNLNHSRSQVEWTLAEIPHGKHIFS